MIPAADACRTNARNLSAMTLDMARELKRTRGDVVEGRKRVEQKGCERGGTGLVVTGNSNPAVNFWNGMEILR